MSKFVVVSKAPGQLGKDEVVIVRPDFVEQVVSAGKKGGPRNHTTTNQLRDILTAIQSKYEVEININKIPLSRYEGLAYVSDAELSRIVVDLLNTERLSVFEGVLEYNIKHRPHGTKLVYYIGNHNETMPFFKHGIDMIEEKDVDEFLGRKPKKIVGKPAVSKEDVG
jgi:hypothetical protein